MCPMQILRRILKEKNICLSSSFPLPSCCEHVAVGIKAAISTVKQHSKDGRTAKQRNLSPWWWWSCCHTNSGLPTYEIMYVFKPLLSYMFHIMQSNLILTHNSFKYLYASNPKVVPPATVFSDSSLQELLEHFHLDVQQAFQT